MKQGKAENYSKQLKTFLFLSLLILKWRIQMSSNYSTIKCLNEYFFFFRHHHTDGAYFGTGFPHMLFMVHPEYRPKRPANQVRPLLVPELLYIFFQSTSHVYCLAWTTSVRMEVYLTMTFEYLLYLACVSSVEV